MKSKYDIWLESSEFSLTGSFKLMEKGKINVMKFQKKMNDYL